MPKKRENYALSNDIPQKIPCYSEPKKLRCNGRLAFLSHLCLEKGSHFDDIDNSNNFYDSKDLERFLLINRRYLNALIEDQNIKFMVDVYGKAINVELNLLYLSLDYLHDYLNSIDGDSVIPLISLVNSIHVEFEIYDIRVCIDEDSDEEEEENEDRDERLIYLDKLNKKYNETREYIDFCKKLRGKLL